MVHIQGEGFNKEFIKIETYRLLSFKELGSQKFEIKYLVSLHNYLLIMYI